MSSRGEGWQAEPASAALPLGLVALTVFLLCEAGKGLFDLAMFFGAGLSDTWWADPLLIKASIQCLICLLLVAQIQLRMRSAQYWCLAYFVFSLTLTAYTLVEISPELWVGIGAGRRWLTVSTCVVDVAFLVYLLGPRARVLKR